MKGKFILMPLEEELAGPLPLQRMICCSCQESKEKLVAQEQEGCKLTLRWKTVAKG